jgi:hypothetical protein
VEGETEADMTEHLTAFSRGHDGWDSAPERFIKTADAVRERMRCDGYARERLTVGMASGDVRGEGPTKRSGRALSRSGTGVAR